MTHAGFDGDDDGFVHLIADHNAGAGLADASVLGHLENSLLLKHCVHSGG